jgi:hypothetical protein
MAETGRRITNKVATLADVRELTEGEPVELWIGETGKIVVRAYNEGRNNYTEVDLLGLLSWSRGYGGNVGGIPAVCATE